MLTLFPGPAILAVTPATVTLTVTWRKGGMLHQTPKLAPFIHIFQTTKRLVTTAMKIVLNIKNKK